MKPSSRRTASALAAYLEGELTGSERAAIEAQLAESTHARRTLDQLRDIRSLFEAPATPLERLDLAPRVARALKEPLPTPSSRGRRWRAAGLALAAACAASVPFIAARPGQDGEFRVKASSKAIPEAKRWAGVRVYRVAGQGAPEPLGESVRARDGLLFSYTNLGQQPYGYLMLFGVDSTGEVRWFYPAYEVAGESPQSIAVARGAADVALGDLISHDFAPGQLSIYALFTNEPHGVLEVEGWTKRGPLQNSPVPGGVLHRFETTVVP
jgi:hypothetical protein